MHKLTKPPTMKTQMLIRRPPSDVFEAFIDPNITSKFWFTKGSARLMAGSTVEWEWEMYHITAKVSVKEVEPNRRIVIEWGDKDKPTTVEWHFSPYKDNSTFVTIVEKGFSGTGDAMVAHALDSMGGFSFLLAGAKAFLEHGIELPLSADHAPEGV